MINVLNMVYTLASDEMMGIKRQFRDSGMEYFGSFVEKQICLELEEEYNIDFKGKESDDGWIYTFENSQGFVMIMIFESEQKVNVTMGEIE